MLSNIWFRILIAVGIAAAIGGLYLLWQNERKDNKLLEQKLESTQETVSSLTAERENFQKQYDNFQKESLKRLADIQASQRKHDADIQAIEAQQQKTNLSLRNLKEKSSEDDRRVLDYRLPQYQCLFNGTCEAPKDR